MAAAAAAGRRRRGLLLSQLWWCYHAHPWHSRPTPFRPTYLSRAAGDFGALVTAVERLTLNDASVGVERESSSSLGLGLRCGFLGLLHMDVFVSRLQSEFETPVIITAPMVAYRLVLTDGTTRVVERPGDFPPAHNVARYYEPTAHVSIMTPSDFVSPLMGLMAERRGVQEDVLYLNSSASSGGGSNGANTVAAAAASATPRGRSSEEAGDGTEGEPSPGAGAALSLDDAPDLSGDAGDDDEEEDGDDADGDEEEEDDDGSAGLDFSDGGDKPTGYKRYSRGGGSSSSAAAAVPSSSISASSPRVVLKYRLPWSEVVTDLYDAGAWRERGGRGREGDAVKRCVRRSSLSWRLGGPLLLPVALPSVAR